MKTVQFKGSSYEVPDYTKWLAMDDDGEVYAYSNKPTKGATGKGWCMDGGNCAHVGSIDLIEVE